MPVQGIFRYLLPYGVDASFWFSTLDRATAAVADGAEAIEMSRPSRMQLGVLPSSQLIQYAINAIASLR
jgi:hypothetical protein